MSATSTPAATLADLTAIARRLAVALAEFAERAEHPAELSPDAGGAAPLRRSRKPKRVVIVGSDVLHDREVLWLRYFTLKIAEVSGHAYRRVRGQSVPTSKAYFAVTKRLNLREFQRWFAGVNGMAAGSVADLSVRRALNEEIARMQALPAARLVVPIPHGTGLNVPIDGNSLTP
jgi:hypothetical protein